MYDAWFKIWRDTYVPQLLHQPKWFDSDKHLLPGDLVYFNKSEGKLAGKWMVGMVETVDKGKDGVLREVTIRYCNASEQKLSLTGDSSKDKTSPRFTIRAVRKLVKIFSLEDSHLDEDIREFQEKMKHMSPSFREGLEETRANLSKVVPKVKGEVEDGEAYCGLSLNKHRHCCVEHCKFSFHLYTNHVGDWWDLPSDLTMDPVEELEDIDYYQDEDSW